ncbi:MAG: HypC/HybG/HupF family hydrogenase formation chaperone [Cyanobacteria bacterium NC_groundwater_1444_Ag_S-0.65um_54_12]|nr:HypC/HybG/HupF family hydrogenase formation chaperone [Cyanobacteria bacterium NC_groundwater_1444_Ag_S-0.65um_54_12]
MCLAMPAQVVNLAANGCGTVLLGGVSLAVSLEMIDDVRIGDYVIVHVGHAICKLDTVEAERTLALFEEIAMLATATA